MEPLCGPETDNAQYDPGTINMANLANNYGIDRSTLNEYLEFGNDILAKILPTARVVSEKIQSAGTTREFKELVPGDGKVIADCIHVPIGGPSDREIRYSGKEFTYNTLVFTNTDGIIIGMGDTAIGGMSEYTLLRDHLPFGRWSGQVKKVDLGDAKRIRMYQSLGYCKKDGSSGRMRRKRQENRQLTRRQVAQNRSINEIRSRIGHTMQELGQYNILTRPFEKGKDDLNLELNVVTGLVNVNLMWNSKKYAHLLKR